MSGVPVITIDGPSGSGKGTVGRTVAARLGWHFLDSGALYRVLGLAALRHGVDLDDEAALAELARGLDVRFEGERVILEGEDVSEAIRSEDAGAAASRVAALPRVREALLARQRAFRRSPGLVADGRDMGTVVFPDAPLKVFLEASPEERARRRFEQLKAQGLDVNLAQILTDIRERDRRDRERPVAPLKPAPDAVVIDSTERAPESVVQEILRLAAERIPEVAGQE